MKTSELIRQLQEADPSGTAECCVDNEDIYFVSSMPGYYDGTVQVLERDPEKKDCYDIIGLKFRRDITKVKIRTMGWEDLIFDNPNVPIDVSCFHVDEQLNYQRLIEEARIESRRISQESEKERSK